MSAPEINWDAELAGLLAWVKDTAQAGEGFVVEQAPLVAQEIVAWTFWSNLIPAALCAISLAALLFVMVKVGRHAATAISGDEFSVWVPISIMGGIFGSAAVVGCAIGTVEYSTDVAKALVAPRIVVIDYVADRLD